MDGTKRIGNIVLTIIVLLALAFGLYYLISQNRSNVTTDKPVAGSNFRVSVVQVKHQYKDGEHIYAGSIDLPNACYRLDSHIQKTGDNSATITFATSENTEEMCAQVVTSRNFRLQIDGMMDMSVNATLNGQAIELNIFEVPSDRDIDAFEINVKG